MRSRRGGLDPPPHLECFPSVTLHPGDPVHRCALEIHEPWWFGNDGESRFDLTEPHGTCYLADDPMTALLEILASETAAVPRVVSASFLRQRQVWQLRISRPMRIADATDRKAARFHAVELGTSTDYERTQKWARALYAVGHRGVRTRSRQDPGPGRNLALFGKAGGRVSWRRGPSTPAIDFAGRLRGECGILVEEPPSFDELTRA